MNTHPYIGLPGTVRVYPYSGDGAGKNDFHGIVAAIGQGGSTVEDGGAAIVIALVLRDDPDPAGNSHGECDLFRFIPDDPSEARRRLEAVGVPTLTVNAPTPDYEAIGRGMAQAILTHNGAHFLDRDRVVKMLGEAIGKGIGSARGGAS